jgi:hypothetical protein
MWRFILLSLMLITLGWSQDRLSIQFEGVQNNAGLDEEEIDGLNQFLSGQINILPGYNLAQADATEPADRKMSILISKSDKGGFELDAALINLHDNKLLQREKALILSTSDQAELKMLIRLFEAIPGSEPEQSSTDKALETTNYWVGAVAIIVAIGAGIFFLL